MRIYPEPEAKRIIKRLATETPLRAQKGWKCVTESAPDMGTIQRFSWGGVLVIKIYTVGREVTFMACEKAVTALTQVQ